MSNQIYSQFQGSQNRQRWRCAKCSKVLSSKRSYTEHMNVHNDKRPYACDQCKYAAASQMTLRRHKLRNHIPRPQWGYHCPHCSESYMEPASYQQHVSSRHVGLSSTFGCKYCNFSTKSSKYFRDHLLKHRHVRTRHQTGNDIDFCTINVAEFLIDDENGQGHISNVPQIEQKALFPSTLCTDTSFLECGPDFFKAPLESKSKSSTKSGRLASKQPSTSRNSKSNISSSNMVQDQNYILISQKDDPEINEYLDGVKDFDVPVVQHEVIIVDETDTYKPIKPTKMLDFDLD